MRLINFSIYDEPDGASAEKDATDERVKVHSAGKKYLKLRKYVVDWAPKTLRTFEPLRILYPFDVVGDDGKVNANYVDEDTKSENVKSNST